MLLLMLPLAMLPLVMLPLVMRQILPLLPLSAASLCEPCSLWRSSLARLVQPNGAAPAALSAQHYSSRLSYT